ncbi:MAG TPA: leucyl aminopeptidase [Solibacterales bacterium]|nr:leucyl aminopeptidase [Bryobacterales bacterium]
MKITLDRRPLHEIDTDVLVVFELEGKPLEITALQEFRDAGEITGKSGELTLLHRVPGFAAKRVLVAGAGKPEKFDAAVLRGLAGVVVRHLKTRAAGSVAFAIEPAAGLVMAVAEGALLGDFELDHFKSDRSGSKNIETVVLAVGAEGQPLEAALERGVVLGEASNFARQVANEPPNVQNPMRLAEHARTMATAAGLGCEVLDQKKMEELGMGALLGVAMGSDAPPALIILRYQPAVKGKSSAHLGLVGKGVTFDTGGISIKPAENMDKMKYDMCGGAAVLGAMQAIARLKPPIAVTALIPAVENMPGSRAQRPGDIVKTLSGKTVEVLNTDAEGRLILCDAITYAKQLGCTHLVDAATLTGAIAVALGVLYTGAFSNDSGMLDRVLHAAREEGEKLWHMPVDEEYREMMKSAFADIANISGGRYGGASTAAAFLKEFADPTPWVHLDIAGTAWVEEPKPHLAKGPTAVGLRTFVHLAEHWRD